MIRCPYCSNIFHAVIDTSNQPWNRKILETPHFIVVPTLGAIVEGWILVISKRHVVSMGALTEEELGELNDLITRVRDLIKSLYGSAVVFEHGPACDGTTFGCGVDHAHFHIITIELAVTPLIDKELAGKVMWKPSYNLMYLSDMHLNSKSYLYIVENKSNQGKVACLDSIPSQLLRRVIARHLGIPELYDYREHAFYDNVVATLCRLEKAFRKEPCLMS